MHSFFMGSSKQVNGNKGDRDGKIFVRTFLTTVLGMNISIILKLKLGKVSTP